MKVNIANLDEHRLKSIFHQAQSDKHVPPSERFAIAMDHLEGLRCLKNKARRITTEKI
ncbi:MAG: hypothetical protein ACXAEU_16395 [Candidatus Hodarchaeales archaeon]|jgi:hypothetical protein